MTSPEKDREKGDRQSSLDDVSDERLANQTQVELTPSVEVKPTVVPLEGSVRLQAIEELDVLDVPAPRTFQVLVDLAAKFLGVPVALISMVTDERQFFLSATGLSEPWASCRETPLSHSFCQHVVKRNEPLIVTDANTHRLVKDNLAVEELGVQAYLGVPIVMPDGDVIGSFCAINDSPRMWTQNDLEFLEKLVELTVVELNARKGAQERQKALENRLGQAQKMQAIGQLVGGVAHDFNNVLGAIQIQTDLLEAKLDQDPVAPLGRIRETIESAKSIVQQLLNWSRPASGNKIPSSLNQIVADSLPLISAFSTNFIEIEFDAVPCDDVIFADSNKIHQILLNLCSNSAYAMKKTGGKILIEVSSVQVQSEQAELLELPAGDYVKLKVSDQGSGIPQELIPRIHDPYFTTKPVGEGTGLGLWTVFGIVQEHQGQVQVESSEQGTSIELFFPYCKEPLSKPEKQESSNLKAVEKEESNFRILVVDDEEVITEGLEILFQMSGYQPSVFTNSCNALKAFVEAPTEFDLVITDQVMPLMSGEELIREIKKIRDSVPVILCSGYSENFIRKDFENQQADAYCEKPVEFNELLKLVEMLCVESR